MKTNSLRNYIAIAVVILLSSGCKSPSLLSEEKVALPETFVGGTSDTLSMANLSWKEFFPDTYLKAYIDTALVRNHSFLQTLERVSLAREQLRVGRGALLPEVSLGLSAGVQRFGEYTMDGVGNSTTNTPDLAKDKHIPDPYKNLNLGVSFQWEADVWGKLTDKKRAAAFRWMNSLEAARLAQVMLVSEVASQYYHLVGLDKKCVILKEEIQKAQESYELTNELMKEGEVSRLSVDQFQSRGLKLEEMLLDTRQQITEAERALALLLGKLPFEIKRSTFEEISESQFPVASGIPAQLLCNRPDVKAAEMALASCYYNTNSARASFYPQITLSGSAGWTNSAGSAIINPGKLLASAIGSLTQPLFYRGQNIARLKAAKAQEEQAKLSFQQALLNAGSEVSNALSLYQKTSEKVESRQMQVESAKKASEDTKELFNLGTSTYLEVLSAQQAYLSAQISQVSDCFDRMQAVVSLYQALGGGREE